MDHRYIDEQRVAECFLAHTLSEEDLAAFSNHSAWCEECQDRLQLAEIWLAEQGEQPKAPEPDKNHPAFSIPLEFAFSSPIETAFAEAAPEIRLGAEPLAASSAGPAHAGWAGPGATMALVRIEPRSWQLPALVNMATALSLALEIIRGQQEQLAARAKQRWHEEDIPWPARFVMQFEPWELAALGTLAAMLLVLMPATLFVWELRQILAQR